MEQRESTSRRRALRRLLQAAAGLGALSTSVLEACASTLGRLRGHPGKAVGTVDQLAPGGAIRASLGGDDSTIVVNVDGTLRAFLAVCTHEGCPLGWNAQQHLDPLSVSRRRLRYQREGRIRSATGAAHGASGRGAETHHLRRAEPCRQPSLGSASVYRAIWMTWSSRKSAEDAPTRIRTWAGSTTQRCAVASQYASDEMASGMVTVLASPGISVRRR